jgi:hypothetical protein
VGLAGGPLYSRQRRFNVSIGVSRGHIPAAIGQGQNAFILERQQKVFVFGCVRLRYGWWRSGF